MSDEFAGLRAKLDEDEQIARATGDGLKWAEDDPVLGRVSGLHEALEILPSGAGPSQPGQSPVRQ